MKLLVVDDEPIICHSFRRVLSAPGVEVLTAGTLAEGWQRIEHDHPDVVVLDLQLPDGSGLDFFERVRQADPRRPVIFITAHGSTETAIEAMKRGAFDYLSKPLDLADLSAILTRAFDAARLMRDPAILPDDPRSDRILGHTPVIQDLCKQIGRVAGQEATVLILGESGTGKELVARAIYSHSKRADKPFLVINCAAIPENLVESELFGHERGAFTGADRQRVGRFEQCRDGTVLLDEIGDMPISAQAKMLRLLQDQQFERVGGHQSITTRVRILAATNQNLEQLIAQGKFRSDLFYRLKVVTLRIPPLRDRRDDIPELAHHFLFRYAREAGRDIRGIAPEAMDLLQGYHWPGNVRQLQNCIHSAVSLMAGHTISPQDLAIPENETTTAPASANPSATSTEALPAFDLSAPIEAMLSEGKPGVYPRIMALVERELFTRVLRHTHGRQVQASEILGINRATLRHKLRELGISLDRVVKEHPDEPND